MREKAACIQAVAVYMCILVQEIAIYAAFYHSIVQSSNHSIIAHKRFVITPLMATLCGLTNPLI